MKIIYKLLSILAIPLVLILYSYSGGSPGGKSGSPGDGNNTCTDCHNTFSLISETGWITTNIPAEGYTPGETYTITATGTHDGVVKMGFELTVEDGNGSKLGGITITDAARTQYTNSNNAITHTQAGNVPTGNTNTWSLDWTAPSDQEGMVYFYAAFNAANGNGNTSGDQIYNSNLSVDKFVPAPAITSVDPSNAEQGWEGVVTIMGENTTWTQGVFAVTFINDSDPTDTFSATNVQIKSDNEINCDVMVAIDQEIGTYTVKVDAVSLEGGFTVDVASSIGDDLLAEGTRAYPNPATTYVNLDLPQGADIRVVDMLGHQIFTKQNTNRSEKIDVSELEQGIYFLQIMHEGNSATKRIVKN